MASSSTSVAASSDNTAGKVSPEIAAQWLEQGLIHYREKNWSLAANVLSKAAQMTAEVYGELAPECAKPLHYYGSAVFFEAEKANDVFGSGFGDQVKADEEQRKAQGLKDKEESGKEEKKEEGNADTDEKKTKKKENEEEEEEEEEEEGADEGGEDGDEDGGEEVGEEVEEEEEDLFKLAWDILETARAIMMKDENCDKDMLADTLMRLGELGLQTETWQQSIDDMSLSLEVRSQVANPDERKLLDTHSQLALSFLFLKQYENSLKHYKLAVQVCNRRIAALKEKLDKREDVAKSEKEMIEMEEIGADLQTKVEEIETALNPSSKAINFNFSSNAATTTTSGFAPLSFPTAAATTTAAAAASSSFSSSFAAVNDMGTLTGKRSGGGPTSSSSSSGFPEAISGVIVNDMGVFGRKKAQALSPKRAKVEEEKTAESKVEQQPSASSASSSQ